MRRRVFYFGCPTALTTPVALQYRAKPIAGGRHAEVGRRYRRAAPPRAAAVSLPAPDRLDTSITCQRPDRPRCDAAGRSGRGVVRAALDPGPSARLFRPRSARGDPGPRLVGCDAL